MSKPALRILAHSQGGCGGPECRKSFFRHPRFSQILKLDWSNGSASSEHLLCKHEDWSLDLNMNVPCWTWSGHACHTRMGVGECRQEVHWGLLADSLAKNHKSPIQGQTLPQSNNMEPKKEPLALFFGHSVYTNVCMFMLRHTCKHTHIHSRVYENLHCLLVP